MKKFIAIGISIATFFLSLFNVLGNGVKAPKDESDFLPVIRFVVASDSHIKTIGDTKSKRIKNVISLGYSDAEQDENYKNLDAVLFAGDLTDNGRVSQFIGYKSAVDISANDPSIVHGILAKSHDGNTLEKKSLEIYEEMTGEPTDFHYEINGFHFIGISTSKTDGEQYSEYQRQWLKEELDKAVAEDPSKPVFLMHHEHVKDTVYGSRDVDGWGVDYFSDIIKQYPQIVDFSGHSHYPLNDPRSIWQGEFTAVGTGALKYAEFTVGAERKIHPANYKKIAQCWIVEVDKDNNIRLRGYDALSGTLLCEYTINDVANTENRQYSQDKMMKKSSAPAFDENASLKVKKSIGKFKVTVPAAKATDGSIVFLYRATVYDSNGNEVSSEYIVNDYWRSPCYKEVTFKLSLKKGYTVKVVAENAYEMQSEALVATV